MVKAKSPQTRRTIPCTKSHGRDSQLILVSFRLLHTLPLQEQTGHESHHHDSQTDTISIPQATHVRLDNSIQLVKLPQLAQHMTHLGSASPDNDFGGHARGILDNSADQTVLEDRLADGDEQSTTQRLGKHDDRSADGDILCLEDGLHRRHGDLESCTDTSADDDLVADPLAGRDVDVVHGDETGADGSDGSANDQEGSVVPSSGDHSADDHGGDDGGQHHGEQLDTGLHGGGALHTLEEDGHVIHEEEESTTEEEGEQGGSQHGALLQDLGWEGGLLANVDLGDGEENRQQTETDEQTDDAGVVPGVLVASPLEGQEKTDNRRDEQAGTDEIQLFDALQDRLSGVLVRDGETEDEQDNRNRDTTDGQVNVEAPSPRDAVGEHTTKQGSSNTGNTPDHTEAAKNEGSLGEGDGHGDNDKSTGEDTRNADSCNGSANDQDGTRGGDTADEGTNFEDENSSQKGPFYLETITRL